ncbi:MAG: glycosyltransferase [Verrucomicrobia bacterium]|nr:glycosyltransferase [Verrucomicrobiota bacterium]
MRIFLCCPTILSKKLGTSKLYIETFEALQRNGADCRLVSPDELGGPKGLGAMADGEKVIHFPAALSAFMRENQRDFDVVDFDHTFLPYSSDAVVPDKLKVARSCLLTHHLVHVDFPKFPNLRRWVGELVKSSGRRKILMRRFESAQKTCEEADVVNVPNPDDKARLEEYGIDGQKILVIPHGLTDERLAQLQAVRPGCARSPVITFLGTFDERKGAVEMPHLVRYISKVIPHVRFRLLGTKGQFKTAEEVYAKFPSSMHRLLEVVPEFSPESILDLLKGTTVGFFPSHLESFGFGVLEMMAAGIPVAAYSVPGPSMLLRQDMQVQRGDWKSLANVLIHWLQNQSDLTEASGWAAKRALDFHWDKFAIQTLQSYEAALEKKSSLSSTPTKPVKLRI